jgi:hypothetical protein
MMEILKLLVAESYIHIISIGKFMNRISDSHMYERIKYCNINESISHTICVKRDWEL